MGNNFNNEDKGKERSMAGSDCGLDPCTQEKLKKVLQKEKGTKRMSIGRLFIKGCGNLVKGTMGLFGREIILKEENDDNVSSDD